MLIIYDFIRIVKRFSKLLRFFSYFFMRCVLCTFRNREHAAGRGGNQPGTGGGVRRFCTRTNKKGTFGWFESDKSE